MRWVRLDIPCPPELTDLVAALVLSETGRGPSIEASATEDMVQAYVPETRAASSRARLADRLAAGGGALAECAARISAVPLVEADWGLAWREHFHAFRVSERLVVKPSWEPWPPANDPRAARKGDLILELDPGHAFGTGSHATTQLALRALDRIVGPGCTVIDVGCGSGILGLAALKLAATWVLAIDVDPAAVESTAKALRRELRSGAARVLQAEGLSAVRVRADVIVANLTADLVMKVGETVPAHLTPEGCYIATGLLETSVDSVTAALAGGRLSVVEVDVLDGWACLTSVRR